MHRTDHFVMASICCMSQISVTSLGQAGQGWRQPLVLCKAEPLHSLVIIIPSTARIRSYCGERKRCCRLRLTINPSEKSHQHASHSTVSQATSQPEQAAWHYFLRKPSTGQLTASDRLRQGCSDSLSFWDKKDWIILSHMCHSRTRPLCLPDLL